MDLDALDVSKENIQPLRRGRNLSVLGTALMAQTDSQVHQLLLKERDMYEILIRSYEGCDPLEHWYDYVMWVEQHFPKQGKEGNLQTLLERCLEKFKDSKEYSQDARYIDLWRRYMSFVKDPLTLYKQIYFHGIGTECAFFYICWAEEFENANDPKRADQVYLKGVQKNAQPVEELKRAHIDFQLRIARHVLSNGCPEQEETSVEKRSTLSTLRAHGRLKNFVSNARTGKTIQHHEPGIILPRNERNSEKGNSNNCVSVSKIPIYQDEVTLTVDPAVEPILKDPVSITQVIDKENTRKAGRWNEGKFKAKNKPCRTGDPYVVTSTRGLGFHVHEDECCDTPKVPQSDIGVSNILRAWRMAYDDETNIPVALFEPHDETKKAIYPKHKVYSGGTEFSLEELRALKYLNPIIKNKKLGGSQHELKRPAMKKLRSQFTSENGSSSIKHISELPTLSANHTNIEKAAVNIKLEPCKELSFSDDRDDYLNTCLKIKSENSVSGLKEKLQSENCLLSSIDDASKLASCADVEKTSGGFKSRERMYFSPYNTEHVGSKSSFGDVAEPSHGLDLKPIEKMYFSSFYNFEDDGSKLPSCADSKETSHGLDFKSRKNLHLSAYIDTEDVYDLQEPQQNTTHSEDKFGRNNSDGMTSINSGLEPFDLPAPFDVRNASNEINFESSQKQKFSIYVDSNDDMGAILKSEQKTNRSAVKEKVQSENAQLSRIDDASKLASCADVEKASCRFKPREKNYFSPYDTEHDSSKPSSVAYVAKTSRGLNLKHRGNKYISSFYNFEDDGSKLPSCADSKETSHGLDFKSRKNLRLSAYIDTEDVYVLQKPQQNTTRPEQKFGCNTNNDGDGSTSINDVSKPSDLPAFYVDAENAANEINFELRQKRKFFVYVDSEDDMNAVLKLQQKAKHPEVKPKLHIDNTFEMRREEFKRGKLPGSFLRVPFLPSSQKAVPKVSAETKFTTEKEHDQSLTVHTREAWNMMQDLFKSPSANMKYEKGEATLAQAIKGSSQSVPLVDENSIIGPQNPLCTPKIIPFKVFNESSATHFADDNGSLRSEAVDKICHQKLIPTTVISTVMNENVNSVNVANCHVTTEKKLTSGGTKSETSYQNRTTGLAMKVFCDSSASDSNSSGMPQDIPYVPSPGMTYSQRNLLVGTENKENQLHGKHHSSSSQRSLAGVLEPAKNICFIPMEEQFNNKKDETTEESDESCCTAAFAYPLFTSTPFLKNQLISEKVAAEDFDDTLTAFSSHSIRKNNNESSKCKLGTDKTYTLDGQTASASYQSVSAKQLSIIQEMAEEKSSGLSVDMQKQLSASNHGRSANTKKEILRNLKEECFKILLFPTAEYKTYFLKVPEKFVSKTSLCVGGDTYLIDNILESSFKGFVTLQGWNSNSNKLVKLEIHPHTDYWDFYIRKEIDFRLSDRTMKAHFLDASKALCFNDKLVIISQCLKSLAFSDVVAQYKEEIKSDLSEEDIIFLTSEVIKVVYHMHNCLVVHGNLSWDAFLISCVNEHVALTVHSFEAAVDMSLLNPRGESNVFQYDYCDVANMVHELLFKKRLDNKTDLLNTLDHSLPKSYKKNLWKMVFSALLNGGNPDVLSIQKDLSTLGCQSGFKNFIYEEF